MELMTILGSIDFGSMDIVAKGLGGLQKDAIKYWIGPVFILAVAGMSIVFLKDRAWMKLISFLGIAAIVGILVFNGSDWFGDTGKLKDAAKSAGDTVGGNVATAPVVPGIPG